MTHIASSARSRASSADDLQSYFIKVFTWMFVGLLVTGGVAYWVGNNPALMHDLVHLVPSHDANGKPTTDFAAAPLYWYATLGQFAIVIILSMMGVNRRLPGVIAFVLFWTFAVLG